MAKKLLSLPMGPQLKEAEAEAVISAVKKALT
jgi:dTDP-4-amino-4,6-dideoxygalactose transaminase